MIIDLYPHQLKAVNEMHDGCILCGGVGVGKTRTALAYYVKSEGMEDIYVITTARKRDSLDWQDEAARMGIGRERDATLYGTIKVDSWNSLEKYEDVTGAFFIFDEQRVVGSGAWTKSFLRIAKNNRWILLSATPGDTWLDYIPVFVANGFYKNRTEFLREHVIYNSYAKFPKVDRYVGVSRLVRLRNSLLVQMPYERHTTRHFHDVLVQHDDELLQKAVKNRWDIYTDEPMKDVAALFRVMRRIVNSDPSRVEAVQKLMTVHPRLIVFYNFDYELEALRAAFEESTQTSLLHNESSTRSSEKDFQTPPSIGESPSNHQTAEEREICLTNKDGDSTKPLLSETATTHGHTIVKSKCSSSSSSMSPVQLAEWHGHQATNEISRDGAKKNGDCPTTTEQYSKKLLRESVSTPTITRTNGTEKKSISTKHYTSSEQMKKSGHIGAKGKIESSTAQLSESPAQLAEWNGHKHDPVPQSERWLYLVQYTAGAEAWNCVETDAMVFYSLTYSYRAFAQSQGRIDRLNTPYSDLHYYILKSRARVDTEIWKALRVKKNFNEKGDF